MKTTFRTLLKSFKAFALVLMMVAATASAKEVRLAVTDLVGLEDLQREFGAFVEVLESATGYDVKFVPVTNRNAAAQALRFEKVDFVLTGPAEYVVMRKLRTRLQWLASPVQTTIASSFLLQTAA